MKNAWLGCLALLGCAIQSAYCIRWLGLNQATSPWNETKHCPRNKLERKKFGLVGFQTKLCRRLPEIMPVIMRAARLTRHVCQTQFEDRRWNCSSIDYAPLLKPDLAKGTREQAFAYALSSAAVTHQVAKACVTGEIAYCPCGQTPTDIEPDFKWKGCSYNVLYGQRVSVEWADAPWRRKRRRSRKQRKEGMSRQMQGLVADMSLISMEEFMKDAGELTPRAKMNKHNNEVGRQITAASLHKKCKCHGVSSSCSLKTCWKVLPDLNVVGATLREKYVRATEVRAMNKENEAPTPQHFEPVALMGSITNEDLVYVKKSPDYCTEDGRVGSVGTRGRVCNATESGHSSCDSMCCGRGYETVEVEVEETCHCKYVHCCYVKCKKCRYFISKHYCK